MAAGSKNFYIPKIVLIILVGATFERLVRYKDAGNAVAQLVLPLRFTYPVTTDANT
jgi:hypothetical protein